MLSFRPSFCHQLCVCVLCLSLGPVFSVGPVPSAACIVVYLSLTKCKASNVARPLLTENWIINILVILIKLVQFLLATEVETLHRCLLRGAYR